MRRVGHILEHSPNNLAHLRQGPRPARPGEYFAEAVSGESPETQHTFMTSGTQQQNTYMTHGEAWSDWQPDTIGVVQWGMQLTHAYPGVQADEGVSSDASTSTDTSSDSGNEVLDMSDFQGMTEQNAADNVFLRYRHHKRRWRRFRGKPVRSLRRHVRRFTTFHRRASGKGFSNFDGRSCGGLGSRKGA